MPITKKSNIPDLTKIPAKLKRELPVLIANKSKNHFLEGFRREGGQTNDSIGGWKRRKKDDKNKKRRSILVKTGALRNDLDIRKTTFREIVLGTLDAEYASYHNEGAEHLPKREFLGDSRNLERKWSRLILRKLKQSFK